MSVRHALIHKVMTLVYMFIDTLKVHRMANCVIRCICRNWSRTSFSVIWGSMLKFTPPLWQQRFCWLCWQYLLFARIIVPVVLLGLAGGVSRICLRVRLNMLPLWDSNRHERGFFTPFFHGCVIPPTIHLIMYSDRLSCHQWPQVVCVSVVVRFL